MTTTSKENIDCERNLTQWRLIPSRVFFKRLFSGTSDEIPNRLGLIFFHIFWKHSHRSTYTLKKVSTVKVSQFWIFSRTKKSAKMRVLLFLFVVLSFENIFCKVYDECDLAEELYKKHNVSRNEIYKHFCIIANYDTSTATKHGFLGIYRIGMKWWCGQDVPGGKCNIKCSDLLDDDISDDVACMKEILEEHGLQGWQKSKKDCLELYEEDVKNCFKNMCLKNCLVVD